MFFFHNLFKMDSIYTIAFFVCAVFFVFNLVERKLITKETVEMKKLVKNTILCYFSVILGFMIAKQFINSDIKKISPNVFIDKPNF